MRRSILFLTAIALLLFSAAPDAAAQIKYGVTGGFSFPHASNTMNRGTMTKFNAGVTCQFKLPLGFSIQPSLVYHVKGARVGSIEGLQGANLDLAIGYLELPVSFQWGPDLLLFLPGRHSIYRSGCEQRAVLQCRRDRGLCRKKHMARSRDCQDGIWSRCRNRHRNMEIPGDRKIQLELQFRIQS